MYRSFCGFSELPFELTPNPRYLFLSERHREALSTLEYGLSAAKALTVLLGEAGTGKTTLIRAALDSERCRTVTCVCINNPLLTRDEFIQTLARRFDLGSEAERSKSVLLERLPHVLAERRDRGELTSLVVDEAQQLSTELLEEIRLLGNIETADEKLLPLVLAGQLEFAKRLDDPSLRQLKQRVALRCELAPFTLAETAACIAHRLEIAGGIPSRLFTQEAVTAIHDASGGIPRALAVLCDNALLSAMALDRLPVDRAIVAEVVHDFRVAAPPAPAVAGMTDRHSTTASTRQALFLSRGRW
jgi:general secretion pathway protein A